MPRTPLCTPVACGLLPPPQPDDQSTSLPLLPGERSPSLLSTTTAPSIPDPAAPLRRFESAASTACPGQLCDVELLALEGVPKRSPFLGCTISCRYRTKSGTSGETVRAEPVFSADCGAADICSSFRVPVGPLEVQALLLPPSSDTQLLLGVLNLDLARHRGGVRHSYHGSSPLALCGTPSLQVRLAVHFGAEPTPSASGCSTPTSGSTVPPPHHIRSPRRVAGREAVRPAAPRPAPSEATAAPRPAPSEATAAPRPAPKGDYFKVPELTTVDLDSMSDPSGAVPERPSPAQPPVPYPRAAAALRALVMTPPPPQLTPVLYTSPGSLQAPPQTPPAHAWHSQAAQPPAPEPAAAPQPSQPAQPEAPPSQLAAPSAGPDQPVAAPEMWPTMAEKSAPRSPPATPATASQLAEDRELALDAAGQRPPSRRSPAPAADGLLCQRAVSPVRREATADRAWAVAVPLQLQRPPQLPPPAPALLSLSPSHTATSDGSSTKEPAPSRCSARIAFWFHGEKAANGMPKHASDLSQESGCLVVDESGVTAELKGGAVLQHLPILRAAAVEAVETADRAAFYILVRASGSDSMLCTACDPAEGRRFLRAAAARGIPARGATADKGSKAVAEQLDRLLAAAAAETYHSDPPRQRVLRSMDGS